MAPWYQSAYHPRVALNIKDEEVVRLAGEIAALTGETKTHAIRVALRERHARLSLRIGALDRAAVLRGVLENEIWPAVPEAVRGRRVTKAERERILGYGREGV
ncbi:MAG: type II toxin-antitoxin system VapB family antitoxin [Actinomycetota bacterium]